MMFENTTAIPLRVGPGLAATRVPGRARLGRRGERRWLPVAVLTG